jgi:hypothetical protein
MKRITLPLLKGNSLVPVIKMNSNKGDAIYMLFDTGSESTILNKSAKSFGCFEVHTTASGIQSFVGFTGEAEQEATMAKISIMIEEGGVLGVLKYDGIINDLSYISEQIADRFDNSLSLAMLVGVDFLTEHDVRIDLRERTVSLLVEEMDK